MADEPPLELLTARQAEVYRLIMVHRMRQVDIAQKLGITQQAVSEIFVAAKAKVPPVNLMELRRAQLDLHEEVIRRALSLAEMKGAPVTAGKDGDVVYDPEGGEVVRDNAGKIAAYQLALKASAEIRKLEGLDAAARVEVGATVRYEMVGVDTEALK